MQAATVPIVDAERIPRETLSVFRQVDGLAARTVGLIGEAAPLVPDPPVDVVMANGFLEGSAALELLDCARS